MSLLCSHFIPMLFFFFGDEFDLEHCRAVFSGYEDISVRRDCDPIQHSRLRFGWPLLFGPEAI